MKTLALGEWVRLPTGEMICVALVATGVTIRAMIAGTREEMSAHVGANFGISVTRHTPRLRAIEGGLQ
jgi:hypothetical protein